MNNEAQQMYSKIITLNGIGYNISSDTPISPEIEKSTLQKLGIQTLAKTCTPTAKLVGSTVTLKCTPTSGVAPFTVKFFKNGVQIAESTEVQLNTEVSTTNDTNSADAVAGSAVYSTTTTDSCVDPSPQTVTETCTVLVNACPLLQITFSVA